MSKFLFPAMQMEPPSRNLALPDKAALREVPESSDTTSSLGSAYFWVVIFFLVYCARPEDWIPGLSVVPLAKIAGAFCLLSFVAAVVQLRRRPPREVIFLALLLLQLWLTVPLSPVWKGGAFNATLDFSKILPIVFIMWAAVTTTARLRRLIFVQAASVATIAAITLVKGNFLAGRITGPINGIYANSNELALILVLTLPLCLAFMLRTGSVLKKVTWGSAALLMVYVLMLTGSRAGLLALLTTGIVCMWEFGVRGRRPVLFLIAGALGVTIILVAGGTVKERFDAMLGDEPDPGANRSAYTSAQQRQELLWKSLAVTAEHPLFGIGPGNFNSISGNWHDQHNSYTQMSSEGGVPAFILYVLLLWCAPANLRKTNQLAPPDSEEALFSMALRGSLYGFMVGSFFAASAYHFFPYFLVGYTTALATITSQNESGATEQEIGEDSQQHVVSLAY
jgi:O-antigen ligase